MNTEQIAISCIRAAADYAEVSLRTDYSGRCMYGDTCIAVVVEDAHQKMQFHTALMLQVLQISRTEWDKCEDPEQSFRELLEALDTSEDNMGKGKVLYWEQLQEDRFDEEMNDD